MYERVKKQGLLTLLSNVSCFGCFDTCASLFVGKCRFPLTCTSCMIDNIQAC